MMTTERAVFLDKDGTLVTDVPYNVEPRLIKLSTGAEEGLPLLARAGFRQIVVSNQSGVARGFFPESALQGVAARLRQLLADLGVTLDGFYYCPHAAAETAREPSCLCRKPLPGLLERAARELAIDLSHSWMVGDILDDIEAGRRAGCRTLLIGDDGVTDWATIPLLRRPHLRAADLAEAARLILEADRGKTVQMEPRGGRT